MFKVLIDSIPDDCFRIHVFTDDPNVCIGRPRDLRKHHIAAEWGDFQAIANENQCTLTVSQGKRTTHYEPKPALPTAPETRPEKPAVTLNTNARGEILSAWGEVLEVQHDV